MEIIRQHEKGVTAALLAAFAFIVLWRGWVAEDAYITFRVIDNFMNGYGLRWNIGERVQVYTHPLWMMLHLLLAPVFSNLFLLTIGLGAACTMGALILVRKTIKAPLASYAAFFLLPLFLSRSFMQYTTSGFENALAYLLVAAVGYLLLKRREHPKFWLHYALAISLLLLTRLDYLLLIAPVTFYLAWEQRKSLPLRQLALGALPLIAWCLFALLYYGFIFPNPKYAKLDTGLPFISYVRQGLFYLGQLIIWDGVSLLALLLPGTLAFHARRSQHPSRHILFTLTGGIYLYMLYVVLIGGDYLSGRFWAVPIFLSLWLWHVFGPALDRKSVTVFLAALALFYLLPSVKDDLEARCKSCTLFTNSLVDGHKAFARNRLVARSPFRIRTQGQYHFAKRGRFLKRKEIPFFIADFVGMMGYYAGPKVTLLDKLALTDPLLARLPASKYGFHIGHFRRAIPHGYTNALRGQSAKDLPPPLASYYEKLHLITAGELFDPQRLKTIVLFNLGVYDHWKYEYLASARQS